MNKKYILCPGNILSVNDKDQHYISAIQLRKLYNVPMDECIIKNPRMSHTAEYSNLIKLTPKYDGDYTIPKGN